jgi:cytochrome c-type biogenesis protein CcmH/NrfG
MTSETIAATNPGPSLRAIYVYTMAALCLVAGLPVGYFLRGPQPPQPGIAAATSSPMTTPIPGVPQVPQSLTRRPAQLVAGSDPHSLHAMANNSEQVKKIADSQAAALIEELKTHPNNVTLLVQVAALYHGSHQFKEAAVYYGKIVQLHPADVIARTKLSSSLYYGGDADAAIAQLNKALTYDPKDANALFNLGLIKLQGKQDAKGALAAWQQLLKSNPQLPADRRATVQKLMANVLTTLSSEPQVHGAPGK